MANVLKIRRGTATQCDAFLGAEGELAVDLTNKKVRVHDGITTGGFPSGSLTDTFNASLAAAGRYNVNTVLFYAAQKRYVISLQNNNNVNFTSGGVDGTNWQYLDQYIPTATTTQLGLAQLATAAQAQGFTNTNVLSALGLAQAFQGTNQSLVFNNGYQKLPGGLIIQWGIATLTNNQTLVVNLPISFPNANLHGLTSFVNYSGSVSAGDYRVAQIRAFNNTSITLVNVSTNTTAYLYLCLGN